MTGLVEIWAAHFTFHDLDMDVLLSLLETGGAAVVLVDAPILRLLGRQKEILGTISESCDSQEMNS